MNLEVKLISSLKNIDSQAWNALVGQGYPFISWEFLFSLEESDCVSVKTGWQPQHVLVFQGDSLIALMPMYLKMNSQGEYVFDHAWASAYARHGLSYYPKFISAIPFTPCQGPRLVFSTELSKLGLKESDIFRGVINVLSGLALEHGVSSWHCLFPEEHSLSHLDHEDVLIREAVQFQWFNKGYSCFDDFLATFTSKRRKNLKRERRRVDEQGINISRVMAKDISMEQWHMFFRFYQATYWKRGMSEYLNLDFFLKLAERLPDNVLMVIAENNDQMVASALSIVGDDTLFGRYWGCLEEFDNLHFELCYYQGIEFCIENKLNCFNSGAQGEHKIARGFEPVKTYSLHWIAHEGFREAIADFLKEENEYIERYKNAADEWLPFNEQHLNRELRLKGEK